MEKNTPETGPPIFRTWNQMYLFVLVMHVLVMLAFYVFTRIFHIT